MKLAPIILFTYNRLNHTKLTIENIAKCNLFHESDFYIFSDYAKNEKEKANVLQVREYLKSLNFKNLKIIERETNFGLAKNIIDGVSKIFEKYENVIVLEDDLLVSKHFIDYMNTCLKFYQNKNIHSISAYCPPIEIKNYKYDVFYSYRTCSWGWATWKHIWENIDWEIKDFELFIKNKNEIKQFNTGGNDLTPMLYKQIKGKINSWSIRFSYNCYKNNMYCIYPVKSFVKNIGSDGSGENVPNIKKYNVILTENKLNESNLCDNHIDACIIKNFKKFYNISIIRKIINFLKFRI